MSATSRGGLDRDGLVVALRDVFRARGWDGASLADLAAATGLSRATLYHHFPNGKADMAAAALADVESRLQAQILAPLRSPKPPAERLQHMCRTIDAFYENGELGCLLGALSAQPGHGLAARTADAFAAWIDALSAVASDGGVASLRARDNALAVVVAIQGALILARAMRSTAPFQATLARLPELLLAG